MGLIMSVKKIVEKLLEAPTGMDAMLGRLVVEFRVADSKGVRTARGSQPWDGYGNPDEDALERFCTEKLPWTEGHIFAFLTDPTTGKVFGRFEGDK